MPTEEIIIKCMDIKCSAHDANMLTKRAILYYIMVV